jgi:hypothetical protein
VEGVASAVELMRNQSLRRLPIVEENKPIGIAIWPSRGPESVLAQISETSLNHRDSGSLKPSQAWQSEEFDQLRCLSWGLGYLL